MERKRAKAGRQWLGMVFYLLIGAISGILIIRYLEHYSDGNAGAGMQLLLFGLLMISVYAAMLIQIIIHEAGHLVFGLATGYKFNSFRIFNWMWIRENGKLRIKHMSIAGTGGQCLMSPPDLKEGEIPFLLYNFGGAIMNLIASAAFLLLSFLCPANSLPAMILRILAMIGTAFAIMNGVPLHLGLVDNDGCNAFSMLHDKAAVRAFWIQMKANEQVSKGIRLKDMPADWFTVPEDDAMQNSLIATVGVFACNRLMDEHRFEEADGLMEHLLSIDSGIVDLYRGLMVCDRVYIELICRNRPNVLDVMLTKEQKKLMSAMKQFPSVLRTDYAYALLAGNNIERVEKIEKLFERCAASYPYPSEIAGERELMQIAYDQAKSDTVLP